MNTFVDIVGPFLGMGGGVLIAAAFIALLRWARGEMPRPLPPLRLSVPGPELVTVDRQWCEECDASRLGREHLDGSFTCACGHHTPVSGAITVETPAPAPHTGAGAGTTQEGAL